jgi:hypothetical protein
LHAAQQFLKTAVNPLAPHSTDPEPEEHTTAAPRGKLTLLNMARAWLLLAEKAEKSSKTTYETLAEVLAPSL